jgi:hypothetical protein
MKARMLSADEVVELVGHPVGGVCPFGCNEGIPVYLDESLKRLLVGHSFNLYSRHTSRFYVVIISLKSYKDTDFFAENNIITRFLGYF